MASTKCTLSFHGAAGNSRPHSIKWVRSQANSSKLEQEVLIYPSNGGVINLATSTSLDNSNNSSARTNITTVTQTLVSKSQPNQSGEKKVLARGEAVEDAAALRSVTAIDVIGAANNGDNGQFGIVAAFSDGTLTSWRYESGWNEYVLIGNSNDQTINTETKVHESISDNLLRESIADISAVSLSPSLWMVGTACSSGVLLLLNHFSGSCNEGSEECQVWLRQLNNHAASSIHIEPSAKRDEYLVFVGSASPRHNKIWVYTLPFASSTEAEGETSWAVFPKVAVGEPQYQGCLLGHQDWITCFAWLDINEKGALLASSGHDAKIRLWKFTSSSSGITQYSEAVTDDESSSTSEDEADIDDLQEGEARLVIHHNGNKTTVVSLEALLLGHEEAVTSLNWRPQTSKNPCLLSSSMDRSILLWMEQDYQSQNVSSRVWVPISRVGSAGGILGGSIGASLMGFVDGAFSPGGERLVGHGYGGSIHLWTMVVDVDCDDPAMDSSDADQNDVGGEDALMSARWLADPCMTGHFRPVQDLAWDPNGEYLLTAGSDQTTRLWAEVPTCGAASSSTCCWMEVARPQVHGYDVTSIVCIGGDGNEDGEPRHRFVSGADEKILRVFDAPVSTLRLLSSLKRCHDNTQNDYVINEPWRVERAFLPSLGLSNKATADPEPESAKFAGPTNDDDFVNSLDTIERKNANEIKLPSERDLGVTTLWPETKKLFGHDSELVCLDVYRAPAGSEFPTLVASSCKARNDVASAAIRLWNVQLGKCVGVLKGGHRSTVSTLSFSRDGKYLCSSGKDRRICIWKRLENQSHNTDGSVPPLALSGAKDSAHKRIVWSVHFCPTHPNILASGSRDGFVKVWRVSESDDGSESKMEELSCFEPASKSVKTEPVTAVAFAERALPADELGIQCAVLGIGSESGRIEVWAIPIPLGNEDSIGPKLLHYVSSDNNHFYTVNKIAWRPLMNENDTIAEDENAVMEFSLASCGQDCGVRIFNFTISQR